MATLSQKDMLYPVLRDMQQDMNDLWGRVAAQVRTQVLAAQGLDGKIPPANTRRLLVNVGRIIDDTFDGDYTDLLNRYLVRAIRAAVAPHTRYMQQVLPSDVEGALKRVRRVSEQGPGDEINIIPWAGPSSSSPGVSQMSPEARARARAEFLKKQETSIRLFRPNPLATYEAPHTWVDPNGYRLSDRIWRNSQASRNKIDRLMTQGINSGMSAVDMAAQVERSLKPSRQKITTRKPYDRDLSFDAMRLARSEITRAHSAAARQAALDNPYVTQMMYALSAAHPKYDICDELAAGSPYAVDKCPLPVEDSHPQCICTIRPKVGASAAVVTGQLRDALQEAAALNLEPNLTPLQSSEYISSLLDDVLNTYVNRVRAEAEARNLIKPVFDGAEQVV